MLRKERSFHEVYNDLDLDLNNLLTVVRNKNTRSELIEQLTYTPFSREEFDLSYQDVYDPIEKARRTLIRSWFGFGSAAINKRYSTGFRAKSHRKTTTAGTDWINYPEVLQSIGKRLQGVVLENKPALEIIKTHDSEETLFYIDPPYLHETRHNGSERCYFHEMNDSDHENLLKMLIKISGQIVLSGYDNEMYNDFLSGWKKVSKESINDKRKKKTEMLWIKQPSLNERMRQGAYSTHEKRTSRTRNILVEAIGQLQKERMKINKSSVSKLTGISREQISRRYSDLFV